MTQLFIGTLFASGLVVFAGAVAYRIWWSRRYPQPPMGLARVRGRVANLAGDGAGASLNLRRGGGDPVPVRLEPDVHFANKGPLRVGERVTVDGLLRLVPAANAESLYRDQPLVNGLDAVRVARGTWPRLAWLVPAASATALVLCGLAVGVSSTPAQWLIARTADKTVCPRGAGRETIVGPDGVIHRCRDDAGRLHGSFAVWSWSGLAVERGSYWRGALDGTHDVRLADGTLQRATYRRGLLDGPSLLIDDRQGPAQPRRHTEWAAGAMHGVDRSWHDSGVLASVRYYDHGRPHGTWKFWDADGHKIAEGDAATSQIRPVAVAPCATPPSLAALR